MAQRHWLEVDMRSAPGTTIRTTDMLVLDKVFDMGDGYVLNFSNKTLAEFFREELRVDIDDPRWAVQGGSKAKRLRYYLRHVNPRTALDTLNALWEYREAKRALHSRWAGLPSRERARTSRWPAYFDLARREHP